MIRFREKRKERNFDKKIRYTVRKEVALRYEICCFMTIVSHPCFILCLIVSHLYDNLCEQWHSDALLETSEPWCFLLLTYAVGIVECNGIKGSSPLQSPIMMTLHRQLLAGVQMRSGAPIAMDPNIKRLCECLILVTCDFHGKISRIQYLLNIAVY